MGSNLVGKALGSSKCRDFTPWRNHAGEEPGSFPMWCSCAGGLTHDGCPGVSKPSKGRAMDFESLGGLGTGEEVWGAKPLEQQSKQASTGVASSIKSKLGGNTW
jgi:hypothetical protein